MDQIATTAEAKKWITDLIRGFVLSVGYILVTLLGHHFVFGGADRSVSSLWVPTGIGVAAMALWGLRFWPAVLVGVVASRFLLGDSLTQLPASGIGEFLASLTGAFFLRRSKYFDPDFRLQFSTLYLIVVPALASMLLGATVGVAVQYWGAAVSGETFPQTLIFTWVAYTMGVLIWAPLLLTAADAGWRRWRGHIAPMEFAAWTTALVGVTWLVMAPPVDYIEHSTFMYLPLVLLLWASWRGGSFVAAVSTWLVVVVGLEVTASGRGPFVLEDQGIDVFSLFAFVLGATYFGFMILSMKSEREHLLDRLSWSEEFLNATGRLAKIGGWQLEDNVVSWTDETYRIHEYPLSRKPGLDSALSHFDEDERPLLQAAIEKAIEEGVPYDLKLNFTTAKGNRRRVRALCESHRVNGKTVKLRGTFQDITEIEAVEKSIQAGEERYRVLAEHVHDVIWTANLDLELTYVSPSVVRVRGYTPEESIALGASGAGPLDTQKALISTARQLVASASKDDANGEGAATLELALKRKDGSTFPAEIVVSVLRDADGNPTGYLGVTRDITERKNAEMALRASEAQLKTTGRIARVGGWKYDVAIQELRWSEELYGVFDRPLDYVPTLENSLAFCHVEDRARLEAAIDGAVNHGRPFDLEHRVITHSKTPLWIRSICEPILEEGKVILLQGSMQDVTALKEIEGHLRLLESVITHSDDAILVTGLEFVDRFGPRALFVNPAFTRITGLLPNEIVGHTPRALWKFFEDKAVVATLAATMRKFEACELECLYRRDGQEGVWLDLHVVPVRDGLGNWSHFIAIARDVSERKRAEKEKLEMGVRSTAIVESAVDGIITVDEGGVVERANTAAESLFGYDSEALIGVSISQIIPLATLDEEVPLIQCYTGIAQSTASGTRGELLGERSDGSTFPLRLSVGEVRLGNVNHFTAIVHDRTHEVELEERLRQSQRMESLGTMAGGIAHDFNNILQAIMGFTSIAQRGVKDEIYDGLSDYLEEIDKGSQRAADLVSQILTISRQARVELRPVDMRVFVQEAVRFLQGAVPEGIALHTRIASDPSVVMAAPSQLDQVLNNLCANGFHAMDRGGDLKVELDRVHVTDTVDTRSGPILPGDYVSLSVIDSGVGIPSGILDRILDPFYTTKQKDKGTGLGLATVHGIVAGYGGGLFIESVVGQGTTVRVLLPLLADTNPHPPQGQEIVVSEAMGAGASVLVVDDEEAIVKLVTVLLEKKGFRVFGFTDTDAAWGAFKEDPNAFSLALLDYTMPDITGIEFAHKLRGLNADLPIVLITGMMDKDKIAQVEQAGIVDILKKPVAADQLLFALAKIFAAS